jgi:preprotein translocase subunit YajC
MFNVIIAMSPGGQQGGNDFSGFIMIGAILLIMYFLMIRPQQKKQKEHRNMLDSLKKGDKVVTQGGLIVTIDGFKNDNKIVIVKLDQNVKVEVQIESIAGVHNPKTESKETK